MMLTSDPIFAKDDIAREVVTSKSGSTFQTKSGGMMYVAANKDREQQQTPQSGEQQRMNEMYQPQAQSEQRAKAKERNERTMSVERKAGREMLD